MAEGPNKNKNNLNWDNIIAVFYDLWFSMTSKHSRCLYEDYVAVNNWFLSSFTLQLLS